MNHNIWWHHLHKHADIKSWRRCQSGCLATQRVCELLNALLRQTGLSSCCWSSASAKQSWQTRGLRQYKQSVQNPSYHTMDMLWEKFQWILPLYMKPISFQSKASVVCSVTAAVFIDFCLKKLNVFSQHIGQKTNEYLNSTEQMPRNWNVDQLSMLITS